MRRLFALAAILFALGLACLAQAAPPLHVPMVGFGQPTAAGGGAVLTFQGLASGSSGSFAGVPFGTASAGRIIAIGTTSIHPSGNSVTGMTIGGVTASKAVGVNAGGSSSGDWADIWAAVVPSGTSGTVNTTNSGTLNAMGIHVYSMTGIASITPSNTLATTSTSGSLTIPAGGVSVGVSVNVQSGTATFTWSGLVLDTTFNTGAASQSSSASLGAHAAGTITVTATPSGSLAHALAAASWSP